MTPEEKENPATKRGPTPGREEQCRTLEHGMFEFAQKRGLHVANARSVRSPRAEHAGRHGHHPVAKPEMGQDGLSSYALKILLDFIGHIA